MVDCVGLARTRRACDKGMGGHCLPVQDKVRFFLPAHMVDFAQLHLVRIRHRFVRHIAAKFCVLNHGQAMYRAGGQAKVHRKFPPTNQCCWRIQQTVRRTRPQRTGKDRVHESLEVLPQLGHLCLIVLPDIHSTALHRGALTYHQCTVSIGRKYRRRRGRRKEISRTFITAVIFALLGALELVFNAFQQFFHRFVAQLDLLGSARAAGVRCAVALLLAGGVRCSMRRPIGGAVRSAGLLGGRVAGTPRGVYAHGAADVPGNAVESRSGWCHASYGPASRAQQRSNNSTCHRNRNRGYCAAQTQNACNAASHRRDLCDRGAGAAADTAVDAAADPFRFLGAIRHRGGLARAVRCGRADGIADGVGSPAAQALHHSRALILAIGPCALAEGRKTAVEVFVPAAYLRLRFRRDRLCQKQRRVHLSVHRIHKTLDALHKSFVFRPGFIPQCRHAGHRSHSFLRIAKGSVQQFFFLLPRNASCLGAGEVGAQHLLQRLAGSIQIAALHVLFQGVLSDTQIDIRADILLRHIDHHRQTAALRHAGIVHRGKLLEHILALFQGQFLQLEQLDALGRVLHVQHLLGKLHHAIVLQFRQIFFIHQMVCKGQLVRQVIQ